MCELVTAIRTAEPTRAGSLGEVTGSERPFRISRGTADDLRALSVFHYRTSSLATDASGGSHAKCGLPATIAQVLVARFSRQAVATTASLRRLEADDVIGVLGVSMPALNAPGRWRERAWPDLFAAATSRREQAHAVNTHLRTISRVIVDPRFRGVGVASALVRAYLASPLTEATEALAAMGHVSGFFTAAGMTQVWPVKDDGTACAARAAGGMGGAQVTSRADARLLACLAAMRGSGRGSHHLPRGVETWELLDADGLLKGLSRADVRVLDDGLRAWARASRATRALADGRGRGRERGREPGGDTRALIHAAARRLASRPAVFAFRVKQTGGAS